MGMRINQNVAALNSYRNLSVNDSQMAKSLEKLSSGFRINRAADDAAGLVISEGLRAQIGGLKVATRNAQDGVSVVQTAEGALTEVHSILQRMRDLAVQTANTSDTDAKAAAQAEVGALVDEIDRIAKTTSFGSKSLLDATGGTQTLTFQVGANVTTNEQITVAFKNMTSACIGVVGGNTLGDLKGAVSLNGGTISTAVTIIDKAIKDVSSLRGDLGAAQNRLEHTVANLGVAVENLSASESRIRDTDMASEMTTFTKTQILVQAGTAMLAQANAAPQSVLSLLRG
jgi:flagellin